MDLVPEVKIIVHREGESVAVAAPVAAVAPAAPVVEAEAPAVEAEAVVVEAEASETTESAE
jgi:hypothetical protein